MRMYVILNKAITTDNNEGYFGRLRRKDEA